MNVEVVVPHRSRWDLLARLIDSLDAQTVRPSICVVDNASTDDSLARLQARPDIRVVPSADNLGFGKAINLGVRTSSAELVILLNNDMVAEPDFVRAMVAALETSTDVAVAALQLGTDGTVDTVGVAVDQSLCAYDVGYKRRPNEVDSDPLRPIGPSGGAAGYHRSTFLRFGGYDESIFAYLEDVDLALRMAAGGVRYQLARDARVVHRHSATLGSGSREKNRIMAASRGYLLWKYRASMSPAARVRGMIIDGIVYAGQMVIDRNAGALVGRRSARRRRLPARAAPIELAVVQIGLFAALRRRLLRR